MTNLKIQNICVNCNKILVNRYAKQCKSCAKKGKLSPFWKDGRTQKEYCCVDCGEQISTHTFLYKGKRCKKCAYKELYKNPSITKDVLYNLYIINKKSSLEIGKILNRSKNNILYWLKKHNIKTRTISEAQKGKPNNSLTKFKKGHIPWDKGKKGIHTEETLKKLRKLASLRVGKLNPNYGNHKLAGKNNPSYIHGQSKRKYPSIFRKRRKQIKIRDNYTCQICGEHENNLKFPLSVHHIDYCITNNIKINLITLCLLCHLQTNFNRDYWYAYCTYLITNKIIF